MLTTREKIALADEGQGKGGVCCFKEAWNSLATVGLERRCQWAKAGNKNFFYS